MIGVFDSGVGGLTAVKEILKIMPNSAIRYFGDTGRVPYGTRSAEIIKKYSFQDANFLKSLNVDIILIACGTATSIALNDLKKTMDIPVIGVVEPASLAAAKATKNNKVGIIGTPSTIASGSYPNAIKQINPQIETFSVACPLFVPLVEGGFIDENNEITYLAAKHYLTQLKEKDIDTLILGCTHYPIIEKIIKKILPNVTLINSGAESAKALKEFLPEQNDDNPGVEYYVSDSTENFANLAKIFLDSYSDGHTHKIDIEKY